MKTIIKKSWWFFILVGLCLSIPILLNLVNISEIHIITKETIKIGDYNWTYYNFNIYQYIKELKYTITDESITKIVREPPTLPIRNTSNFDAVGWLKYLTNVVIIYSLNFASYVLSIILFAPIKLLFYPIRFLMSLLGFRTSNLVYVNMFNKIYNFSIPTINYLS